MIAAGFGFRSNATFDSFRSAFENTIYKHKFSKPMVLAAPHDKVNHKSLIFFARNGSSLIKNFTLFFLQIFLIFFPIEIFCLNEYFLSLN